MTVNNIQLDELKKAAGRLKEAQPAYRQPQQEVLLRWVLGLVEDPAAWISFIDARSLSSHAYKESLAEQVYASAQALPPFVNALIKKLKR
jgi:hypothetical protein